MLLRPYQLIYKWLYLTMLAKLMNIRGMTETNREINLRETENTGSQGFQTK